MRNYVHPALFFGGSLLILLIGFSLYYVRLSDAGETIIIHYLAKSGVDVLGEKNDVLKMLGAGAGITVINALIVSALWSRNRVLARLMSISTLFIALLILLAVTAIINVNT